MQGKATISSTVEWAIILSLAVAAAIYLPSTQALALNNVLTSIMSLRVNYQAKISRVIAYSPVKCGKCDSEAEPSVHRTSAAVSRSHLLARTEPNHLDRFVTLALRDNLFIVIYALLTIPCI